MMNGYTKTEDGYEYKGILIYRDWGVGIGVKGSTRVGVREFCGLSDAAGYIDLMLKRGRTPGLPMQAYCD